MTEIAHTKGPWEVYDDDTSDELSITAAGRDGKVAIATVSIGLDEPFDSEQRANAQLLSAAPALLEALRDAAHRVAWLAQFVDDRAPIDAELAKWGQIIGTAAAK